MNEHLECMTTLAETFNTKAYLRLIQIDGIVDRIASGDATHQDYNIFWHLEIYELDAYGTFCETKIQALKDEVERRAK